MNADLYRKMLLIRTFEERILDLFSKGKIFGTTHAYIGQEANAVGVPVLAIKSELGLDKSLINDYKNGFWVDECSPDALAKKILEIYSYIKKHRNKFYNNCKYFASSYDIDLLGERVEQIYYE